MSFDSFDSFDYVLLGNADSLPQLELPPFRCVLVGEAAMPDPARDTINAWLQQQGCVYFMAWGKDASNWAEGFRKANIAAFTGSMVPDAGLAITTCHESERLKDVFWFALNSAMHPCHPLENLLVLHCGTENRKAEFAKLLSTPD